LLQLLTHMHKIVLILLWIVGATTFINASSIDIHEPEYDVRIEQVECDEFIVPRDSASLDSLICYKMAENHIPGLTSMAIRDGQILWNQSYGYAVLEDSMPVADTTIFYLGSVSKTATGVALMQVWENYPFDLGDDVSDYLTFTVRNPLYPDSVITIRMIMTHMSSINDNYDILGPLNIQGDSPIPLGYFLEQYLVPGGEYYSPDNYNPWPPATQDDYCNVAAALAGYLVETVADSFPIWCHDSLFEILSMNETSYFLVDLDTSNIAMPYHWDGSTHVPYGHIGKPYYPCGTLRTSSNQLARFLVAFMQYGLIDDTVRILDSATVELMTTPQYPILNPEQGLFWYRKFLDGRWIWGHQGVFDGIRTRIAFDRSNNTGAIVLTNGEDISSVTQITIALLNYAAQFGVAEKESRAAMPSMVRLFQNCPNPFHSVTNIRFVLPEADDISLKIYNVIGQEVRTLVDHKLEAGEHKIVWNAGGIPSGVYYYRLSTGDQSRTKRTILLN